MTDRPDTRLAGNQRREPLLSARNIRVQFGGLVAVDDVDLDIAAGDLVALIGPNGAGKSTLFNALTGFIRPASGTVHFGGRDISRLAPYQRARAGLVRTFQLPRAFARMTVLDNLVLASPLQPGQRLRRALVLAGASARDDVARELALEQLASFGLAEKADDFAGELSGGQRKLLELARALMLEPRMLLLDEPMAGVNPALGEELIAHIERLRDDGMTVLFVEHDMDVVMNHADRVVCLAEGRIIADAGPAEVQRDPRVLAAYLGDSLEGVPDA